MSLNSIQTSKKVTPKFDDYLKPGVEVIHEVINPGLLVPLSNLMQDSPSFRLFTIDMLASCEYLPQELGECVSESCEVYPIDEEEVPSNIIDVDRREWAFDLDGWARWDMPSEDYYDTQDFQESYTSYDGREVWDFVHAKIEFPANTATEDSWRNDYNKAVRGLHGSISAHILMSIKGKIEGGEMNEEGIRWEEEIERRIYQQPEAIENMYFLYMLLLSAVREARVRLIEDCENGSIDEATSKGLKALLEEQFWRGHCDTIDLAANQIRSHGTGEDDTFWKARNRTRELMRIMNCVQCNVCKLHGKIAVLGVSTALQILLGKEGDGVDADRIDKLKRVELAALLTTTGKLARAVEFINNECVKK